MQIKVEGTHTVTERIKVVVDARDAFDQIVRSIYRKANIQTALVDLFIEDGKIKCEYEEYTSHSYFVKKTVCESPTEEQMKAVQLVNEFRQLLHKAF